MFKRSIKTNKIRTVVCLSFALIMPLISSCGTKAEQKKVSKTYVFEEKHPTYNSIEEAKQDLDKEKQMFGESSNILK